MRWLARFSTTRPSVPASTARPTPPWPQLMPRPVTLTASSSQEPGVTSLDDGLLYKVIEPGASAPAAEGARMWVHYRGSLVDRIALIWKRPSA